MQEWIVAMLVISILLIFRDMAKTILARRTRTEAGLLAGEEHPQKERIIQYAQSFRKLADTFYGMPYRRDYLSSGQVNRILAQTREQVCERCFQNSLCWGERSSEMARGGEALIRTLEEGEEERVQEIRGSWMSVCGHSGQFWQELCVLFREERQNLVWDNRMIENRLAVAQQLTETSRILERAAENLYDLTPAGADFQKELSRRLGRRHVILKNAWMMERTEGRRQVFLSLRARSGQCVAVTEVARILSDICGMDMAPVQGGRSIVNGDFHMLHFVEDVSYQLLYGVARLTREQEKVSGDNYICRQEENGKFFLCLSDGMGSGMEAFRESETVVELLEQFMESGFTPETAAKMVNSALVLGGREGMFSTVDICAVDLYTGICNFLKAGASSTFIKRDHWVEAISSESPAAGLVQQAEFDMASRKLYHGDYLIMMTDGVLDALPEDREEETMKEIILDIRDDTPKEISRGILERVLGYSDYRAKDDMTVVAAGLWKK
ncbi:MAG: SpoIIE family protein phosphatase [Clostridiales bacterium]|nr:SpoIIE family protein phosphatase [Clostridiales bacterium]